MPFYHADDNDGYSHDDHDSYHDDHNNSYHDDDNSPDDDHLPLSTPVYMVVPYLDIQVDDDDDDDSDDDDHVDDDDNHLPTPVYRRRWLPTSSTFKSNPRSASDGDAPVQRVQVVDLWWHWK